MTTTPRPTKLLRDLLGRDDGSVHVTRGTTFDNAANLSPSALAELRRRYDGTRLGHQELLGEPLQDVEDALWSRDIIEPYRITSFDRGQLVRVVVAVDPATSSGEKSDETGVIVAGVSATGEGYVLDDLTCQLPPNA